jgi:ABC-type transport system involved in multi-copper enzyme maturation permease subunit
MLGPVFSAEMLRAGRRGRAHVLRWIYAAWLCMQLLYVYDQANFSPTTSAGTGRPNRAKIAADFSQRLRDLILGQQFILIVLVTPAFVAGAITDEKTRGTLQALLTAHVTPTDIVLGKLFGRCAQVGTLALTPLPLLALIGPVAGIPPEFLVILIAVTALVLFGLGGVSLLASVWFRQTRTAVIVTYVVFAGGWLAAESGWVPGEWPAWFDAKRALDPAVDRDNLTVAFRHLGQAAIAWGGLGLMTTILAIWRLRPAYLRQMEARPRGRLALGRLWPRPRPTRDPLAWKERYVGLRVPRWVGLPVVVAIGAVFMAVAFSDVAGGMGGTNSYYRNSVLYSMGGWSLLLATLVVGVRCSGTITGERERQTWDGIMTTPLTIQRIVRGKLYGIICSTWPYVLAFWFGAMWMAGLTLADDPRLMIAMLLSVPVGFGLAALPKPRWGEWAVTALVILVAFGSGFEAGIIVGGAMGVTWLAMYFLGVVGLYCSARSQTSWRSLLGTVSAGYVGGFALFCLSTPVSCLSMLVLSVIVGAVREVIELAGTPSPPVFREQYVAIFWMLGSAGVFWLVARAILASAEATVAKTDRIAPNWVRMIEQNLPRYGPSGPRRWVRRQ